MLVVHVYKKTVLYSNSATVTRLACLACDSLWQVFQTFSKLSFMLEMLSVWWRICPP